MSLPVKKAPRGGFFTILLFDGECHNLPFFQQISSNSVSGAIIAGVILFIIFIIPFSMHIHLVQYSAHQVGFGMSKLIHGLFHKFPTHASRLDHKNNPIHVGSQSQSIAGWQNGGRIHNHNIKKVLETGEQE